ncbi:hypothetical protein PAPYR_9044 [Paratrimastix pyriformis]|uniref:Uncharacterized protein n=1 Tax=Paratrimastix pyriformis TaxID=342808 RepID=A0ABQ8UF05_9EUKA|nr:hypothetical protein PAPYR_9044 [Paratrimastix pyriformis]
MSLCRGWIPISITIPDLPIPAPTECPAVPRSTPPARLADEEAVSNPGSREGQRYAELCRAILEDDQSARRPGHGARDVDMSQPLAAASPAHSLPLRSDWGQEEQSGQRKEFQGG